MCDSKQVETRAKQLAAAAFTAVGSKQRWRQADTSRNPWLAELNEIFADFWATLVHPTRFDGGPWALSLRNMATNFVRETNYLHCITFIARGEFERPNSRRVNSTHDSVRVGCRKEHKVFFFFSKKI